MSFVYGDAITTAIHAKKALTQFCRRIEIAGSLRRKKSEVKDIEIVCIPDTARLFEFVEAVSRWPRIKGQPTGKYTQRILPSGIKLDLFITTPDCWACIYLIRTGSAEFSQGIVTYAHSKDIKFKDGRLWYVEKIMGVAPPNLIPVPDIFEEEDVFRVLKMPYYPPEKREVWPWK